MKIPDKLKYLLKGTFLDKRKKVNSQYNFLINSKNVRYVNEQRFDYYVELNNQLKCLIRKRDSSDIQVFNQIFLKEEYNVVCSILNLNSPAEKNIIIDAGANVGYSSLYFFSNVCVDHLYIIEPDELNFANCKKNIEFNLANDEFTLINKALSHKSDTRFDLQRNFRDGLDWSIVTNENPKGDVLGVTIPQLINEFSINLISLLKIDIEGFERFIFNNTTNLNFLRFVKVIAIEIHDEFDCRDTIEKLLRLNSFILLYSGELTIGINKKYYE